MVSPGRRVEYTQLKIRAGKFQRNNYCDSLRCVTRPGTPQADSVDEGKRGEGLVQLYVRGKEGKYRRFKYIF